MRKRYRVFSGDNQHEYLCVLVSLGVPVGHAKTCASTNNYCANRHTHRVCHLRNVCDCARKEFRVSKNLMMLFICLLHWGVA
jgi:hypothetical protein